MEVDLKGSDKDTSGSVKDGVNNAAGSNLPLEDDVPANFFDDFMNEDFIDGLNVVDTWDEEEAKKTNSTKEAAKSNLDNSKRSYSPKGKRERSHSSKLQKSPDKKRSSSKDQERRDPNKTQRDILRDKDKCAKDQKAKLISEKLKVVETGLVPPGMEMEVDITQLPSSNIENKLQKIRKSVERNRSPDYDHKYKRLSPNRIRRSPIRKNRSPMRRPRSRSRSPHRRMGSPRRNIGRHFEERSSMERILEARRSLERRLDETGMMIRRKERSIDRRLEERREKRRRSSSRSPRRHRPKSPGSDLSDRERWLRRQSRSRSRSPRRNKSFLQELGAKLNKPSDKKSFLTELKETLHKPNETNPNIVPRPTHPNFIPTPVPPPQNFIPQTLIVPPQQEYDQQFFIGQPELGGTPVFSQHMGHPLGFMPQDPGSHMIALQTVHIPYVMDTAVPQPVPMPDYIPLTPQAQPPQQTTPLLGKEALSKLFNDKKITLSDYLSLTGKFTDESRPENIQNKIKVISDCQDVIKELSTEAKPGGRLTVRKIARPAEKIVEVKHQSPFKKVPSIRFQYTTRLKPNEEKQTMASLLTKLLSRFGKEAVSEENQKPLPQNEVIVVQSLPPPPPVMCKEEKKVFMSSSSKTISCQTDRVKCPECEIRDDIVFADGVTQTSDCLTFDIGCQVSPDDFPKSPAKGILKNQSLAYMTPAQLLANARDESPPPSHPKFSFDTPSESKRPNRGTALNDSFNDDEGFHGRFNRNNEFDNFDRYRSESERHKGPLMFERERAAGSAGNRDFSGPTRSSGSFRYQQRNANQPYQGVDSQFNSRSENPNPYGSPGKPIYNQPGGMFDRGGRRF